MVVHPGRIALAAVLVGVIALALRSDRLMAQAQRHGSGNDLLLSCRPLVEASAGRLEEPSLEDLAGVSYCRGVLDAIIASEILAQQIHGTRLFCVPDANTGREWEQMAQVIVDYLDGHPLLHENGPVLAITGLIEAWPCLRVVDQIAEAKRRAREWRPTPLGSSSRVSRLVRLPECAR